MGNLLFNCINKYETRVPFLSGTRIFLITQESQLLSLYSFKLLCVMVRKVRRNWLTYLLSILTVCSFSSLLTLFYFILTFFFLLPLFLYPFKMSLISYILEGQRFHTTSQRHIRKLVKFIASGIFLSLSSPSASNNSLNTNSKCGRPCKQMANNVSEQ